MEQIQKTTDYSLFKKMVGNRDLIEGHVLDIIEEIKKKDRGAVEPIKVNEKFEVADGQHALEARKRMGLPVYFIVKNDLSLVDVQSMNSLRSPWLWYNYMESYIILGVEEYKRFKLFYESHRFSFTTALEVYCGSSRGVLPPFKSGNLKKSDSIDVNLVAEELDKFISYIPLSELGARTFYRTAIWLINENYGAWLRLMEKVQTGSKIGRRQNRSEYIIQFEHIINTGNAGKPFRITD